MTDSPMRRSWADSAVNRAEHRRGCRIAASLPRRQVLRRVIRGGRIISDTLECGHDYSPCNDRAKQFTRTRRCGACSPTPRNVHHD